MIRGNVIRDRKGLLDATLINPPRGLRVWLPVRENSMSARAIYMPS
jgi:hypothetical protein